MTARDTEPWNLPHMGNQANDANHDAAILANREIVDAINCSEPDDEPGCTPAQRRAAFDDSDCLTEHPLVCVAVAVFVIVGTAMASSHFPGPWWAR